MAREREQESQEGGIVRGEGQEGGRCFGPHSWPRGGRPMDSCHCAKRRQLLGSTFISRLAGICRLNWPHRLHFSCSHRRPLPPPPPLSSCLAGCHVNFVMLPRSSCLRFLPCHCLSFCCSRSFCPCLLSGWLLHQFSSTRHIQSGGGSLGVAAFSSCRVVVSRFSALTPLV